MDIKKKSFWINLSLINLCVVAFLGFSMRTKFLFPVPFINYRNFLSAHSHFAFGGWVGLVLTTLLVFRLLPPERSGKKIYLWILAGMEISSVGMVLSFPWEGYGPFSIVFSTLYIFVTYLFGFVYIKDILKTPQARIIRMLTITALASLVLSSVGPFTLAYMMMTGLADSHLYRDSIYTFLHFQYNGFFALSVFALFFDYMMKKGISPDSNMKRFVLFICISTLPAVFLSLLWHDLRTYYLLATVGCFFLLIALYFFIRLFISIIKDPLSNIRMVRNFWLISLFSFGLKVMMNIGTIIPQLGHAVYGDRPVIIGFLHLVFLAFVTFFILGLLIDRGYFFRKGKLMRIPFFVFGFGIIFSEMLLMVQGLQILFKTNNYLYSWLLWISAIILFIGAFMIMVARFRADKV